MGKFKGFENENLISQGLEKYYCIKSERKVKSCDDNWKLELRIARINFGDFSIKFLGLKYQSTQITRDLHLLL